LNLPEGFKPMKGEAAQIEDVVLPCDASPKIDGYRCIISGGVAYTAALKPHGNLFVQKWARENAEALEGLDGELVVGAVNDPNVFENTGGAIRRKDGEPDFTFWVFDCLHNPDAPFWVRQDDLRILRHTARYEAAQRIRIVPTHRIHTRSELQAIVRHHVTEGFEGTMVRHDKGPYKFGRSTIREGFLLKLKSFVDHEAEVIGVIEEMRNLNKAEKNALGRTERSSHAANKVGKGTLGGFLCRGLNGPFKGVEFSVATGTLTKGQKQALWDDMDGIDPCPLDPKTGLRFCDNLALECGSRCAIETEYTHACIGQVITYKHMEHSGGYAKPRHAGFLRFRPKWDVAD